MPNARSAPAMNVAPSFSRCAYLVSIQRVTIALALSVGLGVCFGAEPSSDRDRLFLEEHYTKSEFLIPMRDGVKLLTAIYAPKDVATNYPIWLKRTPYSVRPYGADNYPDPSGSLKHYLREKFIFALQDVRGRNGSQGEFVHVRPHRSTQQPEGNTDESTDAWDTIEWLVNHVPNNNGNVGLSGISYPGFYAACGAIDTHPALKAVSPQAPVSEWFIGDDFHHNGALYLPHAFNFLAHFEQKLDKPMRENPKRFDYETPNGYEFYLHLGPLANADLKFFKGSIPFWKELMQHERYDSFWQARDLRPQLKKIRAPVLTVGGWYDAEDLFGALHVYAAIERQNPGIVNSLVMGPWAHGQWHDGDGMSLGHINFRARTSEYFREHIELPFFKHYLKGGTNLNLAEATVFETGTAQWRRFNSWPPSNAAPRALYLQAGQRLGFDPPAESNNAYDEYVSDPAKPVPFIPNIAQNMTREHMLDDQRFAATRPDVLVYQTEPLEADFTIAGPIAVDLQVSTTGTDSDWVVKLIDVYSPDYPNPDPNPTGIQMGGYQQLVRAEPMRGKFRDSFSNPIPFEPGKVTTVRWTMPDAFHTFRRGHRVMVQVQSSWFPLVDRNPQTFCNIYNAQAADFQKATQRVYRSAGGPSLVRVHELSQGH